MLSIINSLYFPKLSYLEKVKFGSCRLYYLDWSQKDSKCEENHQKWLMQYHPDKDHRSLYRSTLYEFLFVSPL